jgi:hypothetical protein
MSNYNKNKGKKFETKIANIVDKHCNRLIKTNAINELRVKRSPFSGIAKDEQGDVDLGIFREYLPNLVIECKKWNRLNFNNNIFKVLNDVKRIWQQYKEMYGDKDVVLVFEANRGKPYALTDIQLQLPNICYNNLYLYEFEQFIEKYIQTKVKK